MNTTTRGELASIGTFKEPSTRIAVVDDEPLARECLGECIRRHPHGELVGAYGNGASLLRDVEQLRPDLVLVDVEMPGLNGFELVQRIRVDSSVRPLFAFATAFDSYAVRAFEAGAIDYLLKPFNPNRVHEAIDRARSAIAAELHRDDAPWVPPQRPLVRVAIKQAETVHIVRIADVDWIEAAANYVRLHIDRKSFLYRASMAGIEQRLDRRRFIRVHRSVIVNVDRIVELQESIGHDQVILLSDGARVPLSANFRPRLQSFVDGL
jgi:two-component system, LytTR family, response regulator